MPEGSKKGDLRLYRAVDFPLKWVLEKIILDRPLIDTFMVNYRQMYWLFGSDWTTPGAIKNGELEIWYSSSPLGPWKPHARNPVRNMQKNMGARNGGRPFLYNGSLYRPGQDCGETYGRRIRLFKILVLTVDEYQEIEVPLNFEETKKGKNAWNGARYHQLDAQQLSSGEWIAVMDGDRVASGENFRRLVAGFSFIGAGAVLLVMAVASTCVVKWLLNRNSSLPNVLSPGSRLPGFLQKLSCSVEKKVKARACAGRLALGAGLLFSVVFAFTGALYLLRGNGAEEAYPYKGSYSQFTLLTMSRNDEPWKLRRFMKRYSRCASVGDIVIVWNNGQPPPADEFSSAARIRVEAQDSLNNRFKADPLIKNRAVLHLNLDLELACNDLERGFKVWRQYPESIVGFFPALVDGSPMKIQDEKITRSKGYNTVLSGVFFVDGDLASERYYSEEAAEGRTIVDQLSDCEDILLNLVYANKSSSATVEYVRAAKDMDRWGVHGSLNSSPGRTNCLAEFSKMYGGANVGRPSKFGRREDGWDR